MISTPIRRSFLGNFPRGTPFVIAAAERVHFDVLAQERNDPAIGVCSLAGLAAGEPIDAATPHIIIEGLDSLEDPAAFLRDLRVRTPAARLFTLVSNAAHIVSLGMFYSGTPLAPVHPLVLEEIGPLFLAAGWSALAIKPLLDPSLPQTPPVEITAGAIAFRVIEPVMLDRGRTAGYLVIADAA